MLGVALAGFGEFDVQTGVDCVTDSFGEGQDIDVVRRPDIQNLAVDAVIGEELSFDVDDVIEVCGVSCFGIVPLDDWWLPLSAASDEVRHCPVRSHAGRRR